MVTAMASLGCARCCGCLLDEEEEVEEEGRGEGRGGARLVVCGRRGWNVLASECCVVDELVRDEFADQNNQSFVDEISPSVLQQALANEWSM